LYLWKRENGFTYQQRIPVNVESQFGKSPIRVSLGPLSAADARKRAIILSGAAMQMMDEPRMTRETLVHSLRALNDELKALKTAKFGKAVQIGGGKNRADEFLELGEPELSKRHLVKVEVLQAERDMLSSFNLQLNGIADALSKDAVAWEAERGTYQSVVQLLGSLDRQTPFQAMQSPQSAQAPSPRHAEPDTVGTAPRDPRAIAATTTLSVAGRIVLNARKAALDTGDSDRSRYEERLESTFAAFLEVIGDHPLDYYLPIHLQDFATFMGKVPTNRSKHPAFKGLSLNRIVEKNERLPEDKRVRRLSATTVKEHVGQMKDIWAKATAGVPGASDMRSYNVIMPASAARAIDREGLPTAAINTWFAEAVRPETMKKPHKAWLPLVAYLTGMRLSEIIYLQSSDIVTVEGNEVFDLRRPLIIDGKKVPRPLKTKTSERIVTIHPLLRECGFIDFAKKQRGRGGYIFPHYHTAKDPADAAQKQMSNWMVSLKIHVPQQQVFHSLRHNAKSWFRIHLSENLADKHCGHSASTVGAKYGFKVVEPEEVEKIMAIPSPRDIDFTPFIDWHKSQQ
jgi:integrase